MSRRAKIVCTLGPASASPEGVRALVEAGMDVARLNLSHGTVDEHRAMFANVREAARAMGRAVGVLADLPGPKIRLGRFAGGSVTLETGAEFVITTEPVEGTAARASTSYTALAGDLKPGDPVLIDDGRLALEVIDAGRGSVRTRVVRGGPVSDHKGMNLPGVAISAPALDAHSRELLTFALDLGVDLVAMSFVRSPDDATPARQLIRDTGRDTPLIAKIEKPEAVERLEPIVEAFDGLMVARGDLGVEMPLERVPMTQKHAIQLARERAKPVIVATQMLESMISSPRPTRAEASDVANAVLDGADALMLSGETSVGAYPVEVVATMGRIIEAAETDGFDRLPPLKTEPANTPDAIARAGPRVARDVGALALVSFTTSGATVRRLASHRDRTPLIAFTGDEVVRNQLALVWGVESFVVPFRGTTDQMVALVEESLVQMGRVKATDRIVIVAGSPPGRRGTTNMIRVRRVGNP